MVWGSRRIAVCYQKLTWDKIHGVKKMQNFSIVKWLVRLGTAAFERSNTIRSQMGGGGGVAINIRHDGSKLAAWKP